MKRVPMKKSLRRLLTLMCSSFAVSSTALAGPALIVKFDPKVVNEQGEGRACAEKVIDEASQVEVDLAFDESRRLGPRGMKVRAFCLEADQKDLSTELKKRLEALECIEFAVFGYEGSCT